MHFPRRRGGPAVIRAAREASGLYQRGWNRGSETNELQEVVLTALLTTSRDCATPHPLVKTLLGRAPTPRLVTCERFYTSTLLKSQPCRLVLCPRTPRFILHPSCVAGSWGYTPGAQSVWSLRMSAPLGMPSPTSSPHWAPLTRRHDVRPGGHRPIRAPLGAAGCLRSAHSSGQALLTGCCKPTSSKLSVIRDL